MAPVWSQCFTEKHHFPGTIEAFGVAIQRDRATHSMIEEGMCNSQQMSFAAETRKIAKIYTSNTSEAVSRSEAIHQLDDI